MSWKRPPPTLAAQRHRLRALDLPGASFHGSTPGRLRFEFDAVPFTGAREYRCRLDLGRQSAWVESSVLRPDLRVLSNGKKLPHVYTHDGPGTRLCLYTPKSGEWYPGCWLAETIVPWAYEWLRYFELWLVEGEWHGGGTHPEVVPRRRYGVGKST